jgi:hypothetical protein
MATKQTKLVVPKLVLTKAAVKEYLQSGLKKKFKTNDGDECLIARFLNSQLPKSMRAQVDEKIIVILQKSNEANELKQWKTPAWMATFIQKFDNIHGEETIMTGKQIVEAGIL